VPDKEDAFPHNAQWFEDSDGDGVGDRGDDFPDDPDCQKKGQANCGGVKDSDGDRVGDRNDAFPADPTEWKDHDGDGVGDNTDAFPRDPRWFKDSDGDGIGDRGDYHPHDPDCTKKGEMGCGDLKDFDGDRVPDKYDQFEFNGKEYQDSDGDGVGDNEDEFPNDPKCQKTGVNGCGGDRDGDGVPDHLDAFPDDKEEWKDSDHDGVGDNADAYPNNPHCQTLHQLGCGVVVINASSKVTGGMDKRLANRSSGGLPEQGYNEAVKGAIVHRNMETVASDWLKERKLSDGYHEHRPDVVSPQEETANFCDQSPNDKTVWCRLYLKKHRKG
jgi:hypothetical protein